MDLHTGQSQLSDHKRRVAEAGCELCRSPANLHHLRTGVGMGQKSDDWSIIPLCHYDHQSGPMGEAFHAGTRAWQSIHGTEAEIYVRAMKRVYGDDMPPRVADMVESCLL